MALQRCRDCGNDVSLAAKSCPKCGAPVARVKRRGWLVGLFLVLFTLIAAAIQKPTEDVRNPEVAKAIIEKVARDEKRNDEKSKDKKVVAQKAVPPGGGTNIGLKLACRQAVRARLKAPRSAEFPGVFAQDEEVAFIDGPVGQVRSWVEAQNSFGATLRTPYRCHAVWISNQWVVGEVVLGDK